MDEVTGLVAILLCTLFAAAISQRIQGTVITLPMVYTILGLLLSSWGLGIIELSVDSELIRIIAEVTLVIVLSTDASRIDLRALVRDHNLPLRLLGIGLPLMMILGTLAAVLLIGKESRFWDLVVLAIILAPTDASLGQAVVTNAKVPVRIRQTLNVESGLNDGIAMPFLLMALSLAVAEEFSLGSGYWLELAVTQIGLGILVGAVVGLLGARFISWGKRSGWMATTFQKISILALALLAYGLAESIGGNGFIAAFCMGLAAANSMKKDHREMLYEYAEIEVQGMMMLTFMIVFGAVMLPLALGHFDGIMLLYAIISLALIRPLSVGLSLIGSKVRPVTIGFLGWFGPRGVASILYIFIVLDDSLATESLIYRTVMLAVLLSIFAHGITAAPGANWYSKRVESMVDSAGAEMAEVPEMPLRAGPQTKM